MSSGSGSSSLEDFTVSFGSGDGDFNSSIHDFTTVAPYNTTENSHEFIYYTPTEAALVGAVIGILTLFGIIANVITILAICNSTTLRKSTFNIFIVSLAVSDLMSSISSPFTAYGLFSSTTGYPFPSIVCKLHTATDIWTNVVTIQHILTFSVLRLVSILYPHKINRYTIRMALITIGVMWTESFVLAFVPYAVWNGVYRGSSLDINVWTCRPNVKMIFFVLSYVKYSYPVILCLPMALVILCSVVLIALMTRRKFSKLKRSRSQRKEVSTRNEDLAILQLSLILLSFMIGYIPDVARRLFNARNTIRTRSGFLFYVIPITTLRLSECLNPIFYNIASTSLRKETTVFLKKTCLSCLRPAGRSQMIRQPTVTGQGASTRTTGILTINQSNNAI